MKWPQQLWSVKQCGRAANILMISRIGASIE
jgi:hypothetical protein